MQKYSSANTSINSAKLPKIYGIIADQIKGKSAIDFGCGKFFDNYHLDNVVGYDPYNRPDESVLGRNYDVAICSNVLNIIAEREERISVLNQLKRLAPITYITVYEGNKSGVGQPTKEDCYQLNWSRGNYIPELVEVFGEGNVKFRKGAFICTRKEAA